MQIWVLISAIVLFCAVLAWDIITDRQKFLKGETVYHTKEAWERVVALVPAGLLFVVANGNIFATAAMMFFNFWLWFDGISNRLKKRNFFDPGTGGATDNSKMDEFLRGLTLKQIILLKSVGTTAFTFLYIISL